MLRIKCRSLLKRKWLSSLLCICICVATWWLWYITTPCLTSTSILPSRRFRSSNANSDFYPQYPPYYSTEDWRNNFGIVTKIGLPGEVAWFEPRLNITEVQLLVKTFNAVTQLFKELKIVYFLNALTLVGSYRNFNLVPWDDDVDVFVSLDSKEKLLGVFNKRQPSLAVRGVSLGLNTMKNSLWKLFLNDTNIRSLNEKGTRNPFWPFVDIMFFKQNATHIWQYDYLESKHTWDKTKVFPLQLRPFEGFLHPVPCNVPYFLKGKGQLCKTLLWNHKYRRLEKRKIIDCQKLQSYMPHVIQSINVHGERTEFLVINDTLLDSFKNYLPPSCQTSDQN